MKNRGVIIVLTVVVSLLCLYLINFTFVARNIEKTAEERSKDINGKVDFSKKQKYLDSIIDEPSYNFLGAEYTYKQVKETELALGLDLQGGMHVTLEVSPVEILKALAGNNQKDPAFVAALNDARSQQVNSQDAFTALFFKAFKKREGNGKLARIYANSLNKSKGILFNSTDEQVQKMVNQEVEDAIDRSFEIIRTRIDKFGAVQPNIQKIPGTGRILVELPGVENPQRVRNLLQGTALLEFIEVYTIQDIYSNLMAANNYLISLKKAGKDSTTTGNKSDDLSMNGLLADTTVVDTTALASDTKTVKKDSTAADTTKKEEVSELFSLNKNGYGLSYSAKDTGKINRILAMPKIQALFPSTLTFYWEKKGQKTKDGKDVLLELLPCKKSKLSKAPLTGEVITDARWSVAQDGKGFEISMNMNSYGAKQWKKMTAEASKEATNKKRIAIILDDFCYSAPTVQGEIPNGSSSISGNFTMEEAKDLANILKAGKLPAPVRIVEEVIVGPTLGKESISAGLYSMLAGIGLVIIFMILYYHKGGFVADVALLFNILFTMGVLASFGSVLTLPGIAGIVLTIGMAVDANVLIFERIKEELQAGKSIRTAIDLGYDKAFSSIFDSNVTTLLTGVILFFLGSGPIKGFALTLMIGIACSFFTAVFISKVLVLWMVKDKDDQSVKFTTIISRNLFQNLNFNIISKRKTAYIFSITLIVIGIITIIMQGGLNFGVDFKGGRSYVIEFSEPVTAADIKKQLTDDFKGVGTEVKTFGSDTKIKVTTSYLIDDESAEGDKKVEDALIKGLTDYKGNKFTILYSNKVGATIADDIKTSSVWSLGLSLVGIFIYVLIRFRKWQFSLGGITALFHDVTMAIVMFALMRLFGVSYEVDQVFVAAILTIVGFSINDTVIVFDRVREVFNLEKKDLKDFSKEELGNLINKAINYTLSRTIMTTFTVLMVVIILFVFGGETLRGFSFALLTGVIFGSYSTIFIAVPMVLDLWTNKKGTSSKSSDHKSVKSAAALAKK
ncbi:MAG TPA: protein translocase subunit SecDF [Cytophagaceae bacterium]|jgi:SecD/SecF fusion protein|nr:protein translocase subunit SecDF [Cytophagaceae bacterium]